MRRFILISILLVIAFLQIPGEKIPYNDGAGWDGVFYREVSSNFMGTLEDDGYDAYQLQHILPFASLNVLYNILDIEIENDSLLKGILIFNFLALLLGIYWYFRISKKLRASSVMDTLGFVLLFFSFPILKEIWYAPFSTDMFTFVLGIGQVNYFLRFEKTKLFLVSLIGGFVWPTLWITGLLLITLPNDKIIQSADNRSLNTWLLIPAGLILGLYIFFYFGYLENIENESSGLILNLISLSALIFVIFSVWQVSKLDLTATFSQFQKRVKPVNMLILIAGLIVFYLILFLMAVGHSTFTLKELGLELLVRALQWPFQFLVIHFQYFGILVPAVIIFFPRIFREIGKLGMGYSTVFLLICILALNTESRTLINFVPFLLIPLMKAVRRYSFITKDLWLIAIVNLILSKCWYQINVPGIAEAFETNDPQVYQDFPAQRLFQHIGPWQSPEMYLLYGVFFCILLVILYFGKNRYTKALSPI